MHLAQKHYWHLLLHMDDDGISEIDDPNFFLAPDGMTNPASELNATLDALFDEPRDDDNASGCRYPARKAWLQEQLDIDDFPKLTCKTYNDTLEKLAPTSATLVFPAAHINSPASMFGHTFLRINSTYNSKLLAFAINYAADADEKKENGFTFAIKGLTGGYFGRYSLLPYYDKLKEYRDTEKRDIWEYDLNLSKEETLRMVRHIWELNDTHSRYYFFTKNCSYNMLWLIEIARPSVHLREHFTYEVIPLESVHAVKEEGLIKKSFYRPSKRTILLKYEELLSDKNLDILKAMLEGTLKASKVAKETTIEKEQKQYIFEAALEYLEYQYSKAKLDKESYLKKFHTYSTQRAKLAQGKPLEFKNPQDPLLGHRAVKSAAGVLYRDDNLSMLLGIRPAYHALQDPQYGFLRGTQIEFLDTLLLINQESIELEKLTILSISSIAQRSALFSPFSWRMRLGWDKEYTDTDTNFIATLGAGVSWGNKLGYLYLTLDPLFYVADTSAAGIGGTIAVDIDGYTHSNTYLELTKRYYDTGEEQLLFSAYEGVNFTNNLQLHFKYNYQQKYKNNKKKPQNSYELLLHYYF